MLSLEGLVTHSQNRGFSVIQFTNQDIVQNTQARLPLETLVLTLARERISAEDLRLLEDLNNSIVGALSSGDVLGSARADLQFHTVIVENTGNPWVESAMKRLLVPYFTFSMLYREFTPGLTQELMLKQHELYIDYLKRNTSESAEQCVRFHFSLYSRFEQTP